MSFKKIIANKEVRSTLGFIIVLIVCLYLIRQFVFTPVIVKGHSMDPTLADGERVIALKFTKIHRFDIVTFEAPDDPSKNYIKRVIGLPGDTVSYENDVLYVNGEAIDEPYLDEFKAALTDGQPLTYDFTLEEVTGEQTVPEGTYFVLGDNRRNSKDSRIIGAVKQEAMIGDVSFVLWPLDRFGGI